MPHALEPFEISTSDEALQDLALRLRAARPPGESADEWDAGISPVYLRQVVAYWRDRFDWRAQERMLNRFRGTPSTWWRRACPGTASPTRACRRAGCSASAISCTPS